MKLEILGFDYVLSKYNIKHYVKFMKDVIATLDKPFMVSYAGIPTMHLLNEYYEYRIHGIDHYLLTLSDKQSDFQAKIETICEEDVIWTKQRNQDSRYIVCRKYTLKKGVQEEARKKFNQILTVLESASFIVSNTDEFALEPDKEKKSFYMGTIHSQQIAKTNDDSREIILDADVISGSGQITRFILRDVNGIGIYSYPQRLKGSADLFDRSSWTLDEKDAARWLSEFMPVSLMVTN